MYAKGKYDHFKNLIVKHLDLGTAAQSEADAIRASDTSHHTKTPIHIGDM